MIENDANNDIDKDKRTSLHFYCSNPNISTSGISLLLKKGVMVNARKSDKACLNILLENPSVNKQLVGKKIYFNNFFKNNFFLTIFLVEFMIVNKAEFNTQGAQDNLLHFHLNNPNVNNEVLEYLRQPQN